MRRSTFSIPVLSIAVGALGITSAGCDNASDNASDDVTTVQSASVTTPQTPLAGNTIPKFVDALPTFNGRRSDGTTTQQITMQEFQQKVLPSVVLRGPARAVQQRDVPLGLQHQRRRARRWPARTIEVAQGHRDDRDLHQQPRQHAPAEPADRRPDDPLGRSARHHRAQQLRQRPAAGGRLHAAVQRARSRRSSTCTATRCCRSTTATRTPGGRRASPRRAAAFVSNTYNYAEPAGGDDALVPRPRARRSCASTSTPAWPASTSSATTATPASPTTRSRCRPGRTRSS